MSLKYRAYLSPPENGPFGADWVAVHAVLGEPSSSRKFPANRENNSEFWKFSPQVEVLALNHNVNSVT
jgi:hypothetical protein